MAINRRQFLLGAGGLAAAATTVGLSACAPNRGNSEQPGGGQQGGTTEMALAWWGNPTRNKNTQAEIDAYMKANPDVKITSQPGEFASYWEKLATQTAGNTAPDIIQMDMAYIAEYGKRGALLNLEEHGVDVSKFVEGTVDSGRIDDKLVGINAGINSACLFANPKVFDKAGVKIPDDTSWTWDDLMEVAAEVRSKAKTTFGVASIFGSDAFFGAWLRQNGKELFTPDAPGFDATDAQGWFDLMVKYQKADAIASPQQISEESAKPLDQSAVVVGTAAMQYYNSNQLQACRAASGEKLQILRFPSLTGKATERRAWYKASMLWSASARTKNPDAAAAWINWWVNTPEAANIDLAERGIPANGEILAEVQPKLNEDQKTVAKFINDIKPELGPTPIAPPPGGGTLGSVMFRYQTDVLFGKTSTADAAKKFVDEVKSNLQV
ncbi:MAG TPA: extracellular solute-binding protein [Propionibacteriaceae bacterium]|nr:extracellular solute-binding protein [Propionibacteriaceae bacterium]